jgi:anti-sigma B factor antagonist
MSNGENLSITRRFYGQDGRIAVLRLAGYIDSMTAPFLKSTLISLEQKTKQFILDFKDIEYVSSAGWGVILSRIRVYRDEGGDIVFVKMVKDVYSIYELLELNKVIHYFPNIEEGLKHFGETVTVPVEESLPMKRMPSEKKTPRTPPSLQDALREIVREQPLLNSSQIKKVLQQPDYSYKNVGRFKIYRMLRRMNLNTREKRLYYAWQEAKRARGTT